MNPHGTERERRLAVALGEELAAAVGARLNRAAEAREIGESDGPGTGWLIRWRLGGPIAGSLAAVIDEKSAHDLAGLLPGGAGSHDETAMSGVLRDLAIQVAGGLGRHPAAGGPSVALEATPALDVLEPGPESISFDITTPDGFGLRVTTRAALEGASNLDAAAPDAPASATPPGPRATPAAPANLGVILDIDLPLVVRFAQTSLTLQALSRLGPGSVLDLDRSVEDAVDVLVNGVPIARGEIVVVGGNYGVRITEVMNAVERMRAMTA